MTLYQLYMLIFLILYFGVIIGIRSIMLFSNTTKINATENFGKVGHAKRAERIIQISLLLMLIIGLNYIFIQTNYKYLYPIKFLNLGWLNTIGFVIGILGLIFTFIAQIQMKNSWRLGIDENGQIELITSGLFSISRNPVYLGLGISFIGFFLITPNIGSLIFLILMYYGINQKINDEQKYLLKKFGVKYTDYKAKVRKWV